MDLSALRDRLDTFDGFDLTSNEAAELINEARRELALRSRYPRKVEDVGPTVASQASYDWPTDLLLPLSLRVNGVPYTFSDRDTVRQIERGELIHRGTGLYYEQADASGVRKVYLYPAPTEAGQEIELEWVFRPVPLSEDTDEPTEIPQEFHPKLLHFVAATFYRTVEDNPELAQINTDKGDLAVSELTRYHNLRASGEGPWTVGIAGVTA